MITFLLLGRLIGSIETVKAKSKPASAFNIVQQGLSDLEPSLSNSSINGVTGVSAIAKPDQASLQISAVELFPGIPLTQLDLFGP